MDFEDRGKYITILCQMHQEGRLDEKTICFLVGSVSVKLKSKFQIDKDGLWYNERLEFEKEKRAAYSESRRKNGKKGGRPSTKAYGKHMVNHMGNENEDVNKDDNKEKDSVKGKTIPSKKEFLEYAKSKLDDYPKCEANLILKYDSWIENNWKTGGDKPRQIKNWKSTLLNTLPHIKRENPKETSTMDMLRQDIENENQAA